MSRVLLTRVLRTVVHDESSLEQCCTYGLAVRAHPTADRPHRAARACEAHRLGLLVDPQPWSAVRYVAATQEGAHGGTVNVAPLSESLDADPSQLVADEGAHLGRR